MKAVFLDYATMGPDLDTSPLTDLLPDLRFFDVTPDELTAERISGAEFVFTNKIRFDDETLGNAPTLRFIGLTATGTDNVDLTAAAQYDVVVSNIRAYCTQSIVEHVFAALLNFTHNTARFAQAVRDGEWQDSDSFCMFAYPIRELSAMTLGIVGHGELGRGVEKLAREFGMTILVARRIASDEQDGDGRTDFHELLQRSDVISLHCPLNEQTANLFDADAFHRMKSDSILINTARGGLVDSAALVAALRQGEIGAAAVDVLTKEPPTGDDPLLDYDGPNLIVTPHIAWATQEARQSAINELAANVAAFLKGEKRNRVV